MNGSTRAPSRTLLLVVADGVRHDVLQEELDAGNLPALNALRARGGYYEVSTCFPSVTGPGYVPFLTGRFPAATGLPGLRWFDRTRSIGLWPAYSRSYSGVDIWHLDNDLDKAVPTLFDLARPSLAAMSMLGRGAGRNIGRSVAWMLRVTPSHFRGDMNAWRNVEQLATRQFLQHFEKVRPQFATLAITSADKRAHKEGAGSAGVRAAIRDMNDAIASAEAIAVRGGWRDQLDIWVVGDHGHAPVANHDDLHGWLQQRNLRVRAHPQVFRRHADVALMVGGNSMAHLYLNPGERKRRLWPELALQWNSLHNDLLLRDSVDLLAVATAPDRVQISHKARGTADIVQRSHERCAQWDYLPVTGDPLNLGAEMRGLSADDAWNATCKTDYPDSLVQLSALVPSSRSGDILVSAARDWDLRSRFEPVQHVSTHGALLREQMMVPLIVDRPVARTPQRTADVMPSALAALGIAIPAGLDGRSFLQESST